jgi:hypothetical protein
MEAKVVYLDNPTQELEAKANFAQELIAKTIEV